MYIKTSEDYRADLKAAKLQVNMVETRITARLRELCERFPNIDVYIGNINCTARNLLENINLGVYTLHIEVTLDLIKIFEDILSEKSAVAQTKLNLF